MKKPFLQKNEPPAFRIANARAKGPGVIVCDHAGKRIPKTLQKTFGVSKAHLEKHFAIDIGAEDVARRVARKLGFPAVIAQYSRLVLDLNRSLTHPGLMTPLTDPIPEKGAYRRVPVPGNTGLTKAQRQARIDALFWPYQDAVGAEMKKAKKRAKAPLLLSIHSFTPDMDGTPRPWEIGVLWNTEKKLARALIENLRKRKGAAIGENQPYSMKDSRFKGSTLHRHGEKPGVPHLLVEFRQDLIDTPAKAEKWAGLFAAALRPLLADAR